MSKKMQTMMSMLTLASMADMDGVDYYSGNNGRDYPTQEARTDEEKEKDFEKIMNKKGVFKFYYGDEELFVWARSQKNADKKINKIWKNTK